ncbi:MAG: Mth938-like domain-containing protein [Casimicrobiaceae bacterium]
MKFHLSTPNGNVITGSGPGWVRVGAQEYRTGIVVTADNVAEWAVAGFDALTEADFAKLLAHAPEIVLLGTGATLRFPHPRLTQAFAAARVGIEVMDTPAACRTFNILAAEGRKVVAALIV